VDLRQKYNYLELAYEALEDNLEQASKIESTPIIKVDASTSCDLTSCNEHVIVETYDDNLARENEELKQEVERLRKDLIRIKGKGTQEQAQPSQDNTVKGVTKLEKGETVTCFKCCKEGHKSYQCKEKKVYPKSLNKDKSKKGHLKASYMYTKPTHKAKQKSDHYILKKKKNGKVVAHVMGWRTHGWNRPIWVPKDIVHTMDGSQKVWIPKT
jgi:hypothetical protein